MLSRLCIEPLIHSAAYMRSPYVLRRLYGAPYVPSRLCTELGATYIASRPCAAFCAELPLIRPATYMPADYALSRVCTEPAYVLSRLAAVYLRSAGRRTPMCGGRYMLGRL
jgi:hypothetical protein